MHCNFKHALLFLWILKLVLIIFVSYNVNSIWIFQPHRYYHSDFQFSLQYVKHLRLICWLPLANTRSKTALKMIAVVVISEIMIVAKQSLSANKRVSCTQWALEQLINSFRDTDPSITAHRGLPGLIPVFFSTALSLTMHLSMRKILNRYVF